MTPAWSDKDERQYEKIKSSQIKRGTSEDRSREIAARTVNRTRRQQGRTPQKTTQGTGNPAQSLDDRSKQELYNRAKELDIRGRSKMNKLQLVQAVRSQQ